MQIVDITLSISTKQNCILPLASPIIRVSKIMLLASYAQN